LKTLFTIENEECHISTQKITIRKYSQKALTEGRSVKKKPSKIREIRIEKAEIKQGKWRQEIREK